MKGDGQSRARRREFLRGGARYALLTTLAAVSATLFKRSGGKISGQTCINQGICSGCTAYAGCGLPAALSRKQFMARSLRTERDVYAASPSNRDSTLMPAEARAPELT